MVSQAAPVKPSVHYTEADDALSLPWHGIVFLNPPYGRQLKAWVAKAKAEVHCGNARTVAALQRSLPDAWVVTAAMRGDVAGCEP